MLGMPVMHLTAQTAKKNDTLITITYGNNSRIEYALNSGTYAIIFNGTKVVAQAYAAYEGNRPGKSMGKGQRKYTVIPIKDAWGKGRQHIIEQQIGSIKFQQVFYIYPGRPYFLTQVKLYGKEVATNYISPLTTDQFQPAAKGDSRALVVPFDNDMWVRYEAQPLQTAHYTSSEVTAIYNNEDRAGLIIGSVEHEVWKSGIKVQKGTGNAYTLAVYGGLSDSNITHDHIPHGKVTTNEALCASPKILIGSFSDWRTGMEQYAEANKLAEPPAITIWKQATPMGWNSWGAIQTKLNLGKAKAVIDYFADTCKEFRNSDGTLFIDLDSFWDNLVKGGISGDVSALTEFVQYCHSKKLKPGIYWAPFADWGKYERKIEGSAAGNYAAAWIRQHGKPVEVDGAIAMDPTYPGTKERIALYLNRFKEIGFEMIKIDFLGHGALESDHFYDPKVTTGMQAYRQGMEYVDSVLAGKMLVYAAISPSMATARYVHMRRIGCDAFSAIDNTEYTMNSTGYGWWQSSLYQYIDADHVVFGNEREGANRARLVSALVTGTLITGDDFSTTGKWSETARQLLKNKALLNLLQQGKSFRPVEANTGKGAVEIVSHASNGIIYLAVFNYGTTSKKYTIAESQLGLKQGTALNLQELFSGHNSTATGAITIELPATDAALYRITPLKK